MYFAPRKQAVHVPAGAAAAPAVIGWAGLIRDWPVII